MYELSVAGGCWANGLNSLLSTHNCYACCSNNDEKGFYCFWDEISNWSAFSKWNTRFGCFFSVALLRTKLWTSQRSASWPPTVPKTIFRTLFGWFQLVHDREGGGAVRAKVLQIRKYCFQLIVRRRVSLMQIEFSIWCSHVGLDGGRRPVVGVSSELWMVLRGNRLGINTFAWHMVISNVIND